MNFKAVLINKTETVPDLSNIIRHCEFKSWWKFYRVRKVSLIVLGRGDYISDLGFFVTSPQGTTIPIMGNLNEDEWTFFFNAKTNAFNGEKALGEWEVEIKDLDEEDENMINYMVLVVEVE